MRFKTIIAMAATAVISTSSMLVSTGPAAAAVDVYTTPGNHTSGGREWRTTCEQYTPDLTRCRAEIKSGGKWVFNNLTYKAASKAIWGSNELARPAKWSSGGREWLTSCNDDWTGYNGCRTFIKSSGKWVFNNIVQFTPGTANFPKFKLNESSGAFNATATSATRAWAGSKTPIYASHTTNSTKGALESGEAVILTSYMEGERSEIFRNGTFYWVESGALVAEGVEAPPFSSGTIADPNWISNDKSLNKGWSSGLDKVNSNTHKVITYVWANYPTIKTMYGYVNKSTPDHPAGRAVDVMVPNYKYNKTFGWDMAWYFRNNAEKFGINYIMYDQKIWSVARDGEGWRTFADRGGDSANHIDHLHVNTYVPGTECYRK